MSVNTIILDWAGTTVDFGCMAPVEAFKKAFDNKNIQLTYDEIRQPMGPCWRARSCGRAENCRTVRVPRNCSKTD